VTFPLRRAIRRPQPDRGPSQETHRRPELAFPQRRSIGASPRVTARLRSVHRVDLEGALRVEARYSNRDPPRLSLPLTRRGAFPKSISTRSE
jgi:hypothetical protein